jgi:type III pantothenate kinase
MLLAIDIGNSTTKLGLYDRADLTTRLTIPTLRGKTAAELDETLAGQLAPDAVSAVIITSVVPELNEPFRLFLEYRFDRTPVFVDNGFDFNLAVKYEPLANVGVDRLVAAFAAREKYGAPVIVCDFGTAATIDVVNRAGEYLGGVIAPGPGSLGDALFLKTSKLPRVELKKPARVIGGSTVACIQSGIFYGFLGLVEGLIRRVAAELGEPARVVATGGYAPLFAAECALIETVDENLMLDGLRRLHERTMAANAAR